jgi:hypothetical protein
VNPDELMGKASRAAVPVRPKSLTMKRRQAMNLVNNKFIRAIQQIVLMLLASFLLGSCGGGGGGGNNNAAPQNNTTITGTVSPPSDVAPASLTIVSLGETTPVGVNGNFSANVYKDGVAVVAAVLDGKEFSLMNVAVTATNALPAGVMGGNQVKIMAAASPSANNTVTINAHTTAVSMVFVTPYFLTNDPVKAAELISIIDADLKVAELALVVESVFGEADPLSNPTLQQALLAAVESVLATVSAQIPAAANVLASTPVSTLYLPKGNAKVAALATTAAPIYYADQDYITVIANPSTPSVYDLSVANKNGGGIDWFAEVMQLNPSQFNSLNDLQSKASDYRSLYVDERVNWLGELDAPAKSFFRYLDVISTAIKWLSSSLLGEVIKDKITVPSNVDGIYLVRAYSGGWGQLFNPGEKSFVRTQVTHGSNMDTKSLVLNVTAAAFDGVSIFLPIDANSSNLDKILLAGFSVATSKATAILNKPDPQLSDVLSITLDVFNAMLSKASNNLVTNNTITNSVLKTVSRIGDGIAKTINVPKKIGSIGKLVDRAYELLTIATPLESIVVVVGTPLPPAVVMYSLTTNIVGTGSGTVVSAPSTATTTGINCSVGSCAALYNSGATVTLIAKPVAGSTFVGWSGGCSGSGSCSFTMNASVTVTANFATSAGGTPGTVMNLDVLGAYATTPAGINNSSLIVGSYLDNSGTHGFTYSGGTYTTLNAPGASFTSASGVNDNGMIVGGYQNNLGVMHGFIYSGGTYTTLDFPNATSTFAYGINNSGIVVGNYQDISGTHGFTYFNGVYATLDVPGASGTIPYGINTNGMVVGSFVDILGTHGFVYNGSSYTTLNVPGFGSTQAGGINDSGAVVGIYFDSGVPPITRSFVYSGGSYTTLAVGAIYTSARGINNSGSTVGHYQDVSGSLYHGFVKW